MFRIDRSSVGYEKSSTPYIVMLPKKRDAAGLAEAESGAGSGEGGEVHEREAVDEAERRRLEKESEARREAEAISEGILDEARLKAKKLVDDARGEADAIRRAARERGVEEGAAEVRRCIKQNDDSTRANIEKIIGRLNGELKASLSETVNGWEEELLDLSIDIARKIINVELERNDEAFRTLVRNAISHMRGDVKMTVHVSPTEYERYFKTGDAVFQIGSETIKTAVSEDPLLEKGGCIVESEGEMINAGVEQQLKALHGALERNED